MFPDWNLYEELGIAPHHSAKLIRAVYRALTMERHPDANPGDAEANERMRRLNYAYEVLIDDARRGAYDEYLRTGAPPGESATPRDRTNANGAPREASEDVFIVASDGSGTHATIGAAIAEAPEGSTIRLRPGTYREAIEVSSSLRFEADGDGIATIAAASGNVVAVTGGTVLFRGIVIRHDGPVDKSACALGVWGAAVTVDACVIGGGQYGVWADGSATSLTIRKSMVEETGFGLCAQDGAAVDVQDSTIAGCRMSGASNDHSQVAVQRSIIETCGEAGYSCTTGTTRLEQCEIRRCGVYGVKAEPGALELVGCRIHDNASGVFVRPGGTAVLDRCTFYRNGDVGIHIGQGEAAIPLSVVGCVISGEAIGLETWAAVNVADCIFADCSGMTLNVGDGGDLRVRDTTVDGSYVGADVYKGGVASFSGCTFSECAFIGVRAQSGARVRFADGVVFDCNVGVLAIEADVELTGSTVAANGNYGVMHNGAALRVSSCVIRGNRGHGIHPIAGGSLDLHGTDLSGNEATAPFSKNTVKGVRVTKSDNVYIDIPADFTPNPYIGGRDFQRTHTYRFFGTMESVVGAVTAFAHGCLYNWQSDGSSVEPDGRSVSLAFRRSFTEKQLLRPRTFWARAAARMEAHGGGPLSEVGPVHYELRSTCSVSQVDEFGCDVSLVMIEEIGPDAGAYNLESYAAPSYLHTAGYPGIELDGFVSAALLAKLRPGRMS